MQTAYVALRVLSYHLQPTTYYLLPTTYYLSPTTFQLGFAQVCTLTGLRGRWEILNQRPLTICDTGHNSHGIKYVAQQLVKIQNPQSNIHMVFGMVDDKDVDVAMSLLPANAIYYWTQAQTHRAIPATKMQALGAAHGLQGNIYSTVTAAIHAAQKAATDQDIIFIGGSNYVVGETLPLF